MELVTRVVVSVEETLAQVGGCLAARLPETRNPKPETRNPKPETRNPKPETRNLKP
jgi:hypothetical protein